MRLLDLIDRQPARVSFGRRTSGGTLNVLRASDRVTLYSETGETVELLAADSWALEAAASVAERHLPTQDAIATATISAATGALRTLGHTTPKSLEDNICALRNRIERCFSRLKLPRLHPDRLDPPVDQTLRQHHLGSGPINGLPTRPEI